MSNFTNTEKVVCSARTDINIHERKKNVELEQSYAKSVMNRQSPFTGIEITVKKQSVCKKNKNQNISTEKENIMANSVLAGVCMYVCVCIYTI